MTTSHLDLCTQLHPSLQVAQLLIEQGALSISSIQELAAIMIQKCVRGFLTRKHVASLREALYTRPQFHPPSTTEKGEEEEGVGEEEKEEVDGGEETRRRLAEEKSQERRR